MRRLAVPALLTAVGVLPSEASAAWSATGSGPMTVAAATMTKATAFAAACLTKSTVRLTWTISPDTFVGGYETTRTSGTGVVLDPPIRVARTTASYDDTPPAGTARTTATYSYTIRAGSTAHPWRTPALAFTTTVSPTNNSCSVNIS